MFLRADDNIQPTPGDFAARVDGDELVVPSSLLALAQSERLYSADEFAGFVQAFPSAVAAMLGWRPQAVVQAANLLQSQLDASGVGHPARAVRRVYGL